MISIELQNTIFEELGRIKSRCEEIDATIKSLESEKRVVLEIEQMLKDFRDNYETAQKSVEEAHRVQVQFAPRMDAPMPNIGRVPFGEDKEGRRTERSLED